MVIDNVKAVIKYDPDMALFRGEFIGLNGYADFYADNIADLKKEGMISLKVFREVCAEDGVEPLKHYSGKFNIRINASLHENLANTAIANNTSINALINSTLENKFMKTAR